MMRIHVLAFCDVYRLWSNGSFSFLLSESARVLNSKYHDISETLEFGVDCLVAKSDSSDSAGFVPRR